MYIWDLSRSVGAGSATARNTRGLTRSVIRLIVPPFPAVSRPSNTMQIFAPEALTHSCMATSSPCSTLISRSYSLRFILEAGAAPASCRLTAEGVPTRAPSRLCLPFLAMSLPLVVGWHEDPAERLETGGPPGPEDAGDDGSRAEPSERREGQQVHQPAGVRTEDSPQGKQEKYGGRGRQHQVPPEPELGAVSGAERADGRDVHGQVDQDHRQAARPGDVPERARAAVGVSQRQPEQEG